MCRICLISVCLIFVIRRVFKFVKILWVIFFVCVKLVGGVGFVIEMLMNVVRRMGVVFRFVIISWVVFIVFVIVVFSFFLMVGFVKI